MLIEELAIYRQWATPLLQEIVTDKDTALNVKLRASLALVKNDPSQVDYLHDQLLVAQAETLAVIITMLASYKDRLELRLWEMVKGGSVEQRIRAAAALAKFDPENKVWQQANVISSRP